MKWPIRPHRLRRSRSSFRRLICRWRREVEILEARLVLSAAFDVTQLSLLRSLPQYADVDGALPGRRRKSESRSSTAACMGSHVDLQSNFEAYFDAVRTERQRGRHHHAGGFHQSRGRSIRWGTARTWRGSRRLPIRTSASPRRRD